MSVTARPVNVHNQFAPADIWNDRGQGSLAGMKIMDRVAVHLDVFCWHMPLSGKNCPLTSRVAGLCQEKARPLGARAVYQIVRLVIGVVCNRDTQQGPL